MVKVSVCIDVSDMSKAISFYTKAFGFKLVKENKEYTELGADGLTIYVSEKAAGTNPLVKGEAVRDYGRHWTPVHLDITVSDLSQCVVAILEMGGVKEGEKSGDWGSIAFCADPFGNGFCVMQLNN